MDRAQTVEAFKERLEQVIAESGLSRAAFARQCGMDRSTLSQLLSESQNRLPRMENVVSIALAHQVSVDWLLGVSQQRQMAAEIMRLDLEIAPGVMPLDERLTRWHEEALGYKIRYVPTTLPDLLKTDATIAYEFKDFKLTHPEKTPESSLQKLSYQRRPETDMEVCSTHQFLESFALGNGLWKNLEPKKRIEQLEQMLQLSRELYPRFRWFLFDATQRFSAPLTVFGNKRAVIYIGQMYFIFNGTEHIRVLTNHFDELIKAAVIQPHQISEYLEDLLNKARSN